MYEETEQVPRSRVVTITCDCGQDYDTTIYSTVNVTLEPHLIYRVLAGTLNVPVCPYCGTRAENVYPFLYHDMARGLFAWVHPNDQLPAEERHLLVSQLTQLYERAAEASARVLAEDQSDAPAIPDAPRARRMTTGEELARLEPDMPPMQVIFGTRQFAQLVDSLLEPDDRLAKLTLSTGSLDAAARNELQRISTTMAREAGCQVDAVEDDFRYIVTIYGSRRRIAALRRALQAQNTGRRRPDSSTGA
ncbi:MAG TPA: CpXC domain-containing protein [Ktedonobacterales bacterium]